MVKAKKAEVLAPVVKQVKEVYKPKLHIPTGNGDRHIKRIANRTWLVIQPGSSTFIGHYTTKEDAMLMAKRHIDVTKGQIICHD